VKLMIVRMDGAGNPDTKAGRPRGPTADKWEGHLWILPPGAEVPVAPFEPFAASGENALEKKARQKIARFARENCIDEDGITAELTTMPAGQGVNWQRFAID